MPYSLILEFAVAGLLVATIVYMVRLNRGLAAMRAGRAEFEALVARFSSATEQAQGHVAAMKAAADGTGRSLQDEIDRARRLHEDLSFLADRADVLADRLERGISQGRPVTNGGPSRAAAAPASAFGGSNVARMPNRAEEPRVAPAQPAVQPGGAGLSNGENELLRRLSTLR